MVTEDSVKPTVLMVVAISNFPKPTNVKGVRSFFGLVNQVAYIFSQARVMAPFSELLSLKRKICLLL